ncbi:uncharacterized protein LOC119314212 [Triticum dicoccoides]|uniref:uncharacterized protein LOC119314212 n=1 Tax=Triticum dicoccoides TaxID=85692 RepID=UPI00188F4B65|nr:uncharacterized protein LOC119314212 [Triticum dicoccoides]
MPTSPSPSRSSSSSSLVTLPPQHQRRGAGRGRGGWALLQGLQPSQSRAGSSSPRLTDVVQMWWSISSGMGMNRPKFRFFVAFFGWSEIEVWDYHACNWANDLLLLLLRICCRCFC